MARVVGLIVLAVFSAIFCLSPAFAYGTTQGVATTVYTYSVPTKFNNQACGGPYTDCGTDRAALCAGAGFNGTDVNGRVWTGAYDSSSGTYGRCVATGVQGTSTQVAYYNFQLKSTAQQYQCTGSGFVKTDAGCFCASGTAPDSTGACKPYLCPSAGTVIPGSDAAVYSLPANGPPQTSACLSGCLVSGSFSVSWTNSSGQKVMGLVGPVRATGQACNPDGQGGSLPSLGAAQPGQAASSVPNSCPVGQCPGTVNGTSVCAACSSMSTGTVTSSGAQSSGGTITQTDCSGGTCTTKTGTVDASGVVTWSSYTTGSGQSATNTPAGGNGAAGTGSGSSQQQQQQQDFCATNPNSIICKTSTFGGSCGSFTCSGDSVQCAIAKDQHDRNCQLFDTPTDLSDKGLAAVAAGSSGVSSVGVSDVSLDFASKLDQQDRLPGTCPGDRVVPVFRGSVTIPFSKVCELAGILSKALIAFSMLAAAFIVFRQRA